MDMNVPEKMHWPNLIRNSISVVNTVKQERRCMKEKLSVDTDSQIIEGIRITNPFK